MGTNIEGIPRVRANLKRYGERTQASLLLFSDHFGKGTLEQYAKRNAKWTDRTNMARNSLNGGGFMSGNDIISFIAHGVDYGKWLELISAGKYAILQETAINNKKEWINGIERIVKGE